MVATTLFILKKIALIVLPELGVLEALNLLVLSIKNGRKNRRIRNPNHQSLKLKL